MYLRTCIKLEEEIHQHASMGGKLRGSTSLNPWEALFASATRPQAVASSSHNTDETKKNDTSDDVSSSCNNISTTTINNTKGGYTILIQHSITPKSQRQYALSSTMAQNNNNNNNTVDKSSNINKGSSTSLYTSLSSGISTMNISKRSHQQQQKSNAISISGVGCGISGPFLVKQSFDELCHKCNGAVIFVSTIGNSSILDMNKCMSTNSDICDDEMMVDSSYQAASDDNDDHGNNTQHPLEKHRNAIQMFKRHGACVDLSSNPFGWDDDGDYDSDNTEEKNECDSFIHSCSMNKLQPIANAIRKAALSIDSRRGSTLEEQGQRQTKQQQLHQPIPIVFESMTPLLNVHGVDKVCVLLKSLGRSALSSTSKQSTMNNTILSPIVVPVLYESLQPSEHRSLEDVSDAFVHLNLAANNSNSNHQHESSSSDTSIMSGVMDLVRRGGSGGLGGKLIRHCIPFHIMKSVSNSSSMSMTKDARDDCYWVLEHDEEEATEDDDKKKKGSSVTKSKKEISSSATDQRQDSSDTSATTATTPSRPRIFLQDDDPEYDDYDEEEDLDDDLDL